MSIHQFTGGGAVLDSPPAAIRPPSWWRAKIVGGHMTFYDKYCTPDSNAHYTMGLGVGGFARAGMAVGDTTLYDKAISLITGIMNLAKVVPGGYLGWGSSAEGGAESTLREIYCWRFVVELLEAIEGIPAYASVHDQIKGFLERNIFTKWHSRGPNSYIYWTVIHISCHWAKICLYLQTEGSTATIRSQAATVLANIDHAGMSKWGGKCIRNHIRPHPVDPTANFWPAYWDDRDLPKGGDTSHAEAVCTYVAEAIRLGYDTWSVADVRGFTRLISIVWDGSTHWNWLIGPAGGATWAGKYAEFAVMAQFDRELQQRFEADEARGNSNGAEKWGNLAINAARLGGPYL